MSRYRFDLDKALAAWRRSLEYNRPFTADDLDELEQHLRDQVAALRVEGLSEEKAFDRAIREMGDYGQAETEYRKVYWGKLRRRHQLMHELRWRLSMLKNYLKVALRNLRKHKGYSFINISGLAVGVACCLLIGLYVADERSFDHYHENAQRIYRITTGDYAMVPGAVGPLLAASYEHLVAETARLWPLYAPAKMRHGDDVFVESAVAFADAAVFRVFSYNLMRGDPTTALDAPGKIVLTTSMARKYFGTVDPVGASMTFWGRNLEVTGVIEDVPLNSHYRFDCLVSLPSLAAAAGGSLDSIGLYTYVLLQEEAAPGAFEAALREMSRTLPEEAEPLDAQPLTAIHFDVPLKGEARVGGNSTYVSMLIAAALFVLLLACVNFMNLTTIRSSVRAREVGMRKVLGAQRHDLAIQFLGESVLLSTTALFIAVLLAQFWLPFFNHISGKQLAFDYTANPRLIVGLAGLALLVGTVSGSYPALFLSRFHPARVLKGFAYSFASGARLRRGLVVVQFAASAGLLIGAIVIFHQLDHMQQKDLGFDQEHVLVLDGDRYPVLKKALLALPDVAAVAGAPQVMGNGAAYGRFEAEGIPPDSTLTIHRMAVTFDYVETLGMRVVAGRSFSREKQTDGTGGFLLNTSAVRALGWTDPTEAIGKTFALSVPRENGDGEVRREGHVIGVVEDFNYASLHHRIEPLALYASRNLNFTFVQMHRVDAEALAAVEQVWRAVNPDAPFNYFFLDRRLQQHYRAEQQLGQVFLGFTALALLTACLGLFGLTAFTAQQRTKEIGVRRVLGASVPSIALLLSKDFLKLVGFAFLIAAPLAYFGMQRWLESFAYRTEIGPGLFVLAGVLVLVVALVTVSYQSVRAALADPVKSLRYE